MAEQSQEKRVTVSINVSEKAQAMIKEVRDIAGVTQVAFLERLIEWYSAQAVTVQREIRERGGDAAGELVRLKMAELAAGGKAADQMTLEQAHDAAQLALTRLITMGNDYRRMAGHKPKG